MGDTPDLTQQPGSYESRLFGAIKNNNIPDIQFLLSKVKKIDARNSDGDTFLIYAVKIGTKGRTFYRTAINHLLTTPININAQNNKGETALHIAAGAGVGTKELVDTLIKKGAKKELYDNKGKQAADYARDAENNDAYQLLSAPPRAQKPASPRVPKFHSPDLLDAVNKSNLLRVQELLASGADPNSQNGYGQTPLHIAVGLDELEPDTISIINTLLGYGASPSQEDRYESTPYDAATDLGKDGILEIFIKHITGQDAAKNYQSPRGPKPGGTPLHRDAPPLTNRGGTSPRH